jgi:hypothetical protein
VRSLNLIGGDCVLRKIPPPGNKMLFPWFGFNLGVFRCLGMNYLTNPTLQVGCPPRGFLTPVDLAQNLNLGTSPPSPFFPIPVLRSRAPGLSREVVPPDGQLRAGVASQEIDRSLKKRKRTKRPLDANTASVSTPQQAQQPRRPTLHHADMHRREACPLHKSNKSSPVLGSGAQADSHRHSHASTANRHSVLRWLQAASTRCPLR